MARFRVVGISFDHMHMGDLLRLVHDHPQAEIAGLFDPNRATMDRAVAQFAIPEDRVFTDFDACMKATRPDLAILCAATADHARYTERLAAYGVHVFVEKPLADNAGRKAEPTRGLEPPFVAPRSAHVNPRSARPRDLGGQEPDGARPDHEDVVAGADSRRLEQGVADARERLEKSRDRRVEPVGDPVEAASR